MGIYKKYLAKQWLPFLTAVLCVTCEAVLDLLSPTFMAYIINSGIRDSNLSQVLYWGGLMLAVTALGVLFAITRNLLASHVSQRIGADLRYDLFAKIMNLSETGADSIESGSLITRMTNDTTQVTHFFHGIMRVFLKAPLTCIGSIVLASMLNLRLSLVIYGVVAAVILLLVVSMKLSYPRFARLQQATDKLNSVVQEYLMGIRLVKAFGTYREEGERFESANQNMQKQGVAAQMIITVISPIMTLAVGLGTGLVLLFGSRLFALNLARPGDISAFIIYMAQILNSLLMITNIFNVFVRTRASTQRIAQVLRCKDDFAAQGKDPAVVSRLEVQNVTFTYLGGSGIPAIKGLSFAVTRGETLAVIGPTGSGKSTICQLLLRFYDPDSGQILLDGHPLGDYNVDLLRRSIAFVLQKPMLFTGTIAENLRYGAANAEDSLLNDALDTAQCDFVHAMPHGLDSPLGSGGVNLSGGQKQRLSLARALLKNAPILLLDDATSALDSVTEAKVRHTLQQGGDRRITITVTQRCATAMFADKILVLENGGAVGFGTHRELLTHCAIYRDIYRSQLETRTEVS